MSFENDIVNKLKNQLPFTLNGTIINNIEIIDRKVKISESKESYEKIPIDIFLSVFKKITQPF